VQSKNALWSETDKSDDIPNRPEELMFLYSWTALTGMTDEVPVCLGISDDQDSARRAAAEPLLDGRAFVAVIDTVRPVMQAYGLAPCFMRTGASWLGKADRHGHVVWHRFQYPHDTPGRMDP
jgi:hypothetical protein